MRLLCERFDPIRMLATPHDHRHIPQRIAYPETLPTVATLYGTLIGWFGIATRANTGDV